MREEVIVESSLGSTAPSWVRRVSWGAIFAGLFVTIVLQMMLTLLGVAVGLANVQPLEGETLTKGLAIGSGIWVVVTSLVSIWIGACVAGRLSGGPRRADGLLHGIVTWSVSTVAMLALMATSLGAALGGIGSLVGSAVGTTTQNMSRSNIASLQDALQKILPQGKMEPTGRTGNDNGSQSLTSLAAQDPKLAAAVAQMEAKGGAQSDARGEVVSILTSQHGMDEQQANDAVNQWDQKFQQTKHQSGQKAREFGEKAAHGISEGALFGFIAMFLGLLAAAWGGWSGTASLPRTVTTGAPVA